MLATFLTLALGLIPGVASDVVLFNGQNLEGWVAEGVREDVKDGRKRPVWSVVDGDIVAAAQITYLEYRPHDHCSATYRLDVGGVELNVDVRAFRPEELGSYLGERDTARVPGPLARLSCTVELSVVTTWLPAFSTATVTAGAMAWP